MVTLHGSQGAGAQKASTLVPEQHADAAKTYEGSLRGSQAVTRPLHCPPPRHARTVVGMVLAMADAPAMVGHQDGGMGDVANQVIQGLIAAKALVAAAARSEPSLVRGLPQALVRSE